MPLPLNDRQFIFWSLRRSGLANIQIAEEFRISRQAVSKAIINMDRKVEEALLAMAHANKIDVERMNTERGILFGHSIPFDVNAVVFVSADHGVQVWYEHEGDCGSCPRYTQCIELLWSYADELGITLAETDDPTRLADELFAKLPRDGVMSLRKTLQVYLGWCPMEEQVRRPMQSRSISPGDTPHGGRWRGMAGMEIDTIVKEEIWRSIGAVYWVSFLVIGYLTLNDYIPIPISYTFSLAVVPTVAHFLIMVWYRRKENLIDPNPVNILRHAIGLREEGKEGHEAKGGRH
ncbi:MAG: hypothetical protein RQM90_14650 [Methanoculleus sp.]